VRSTDRRKRPEATPIAGIYVRLQIASHNQFLFAKDSFSAMMIT
jgi:hypothetical protein